MYPSLYTNNPTKVPNMVLYYISPCLLVGDAYMLYDSPLFLPGLLQQVSDPRVIYYAHKTTFVIQIAPDYRSYMKLAPGW